MNRFILMTGLLSAAALAQTVTVATVAFRQLSDPTRDTYTYGAAECSDTISIGWTNTTTINFTQCGSQQPMEVWLTSGECQNEPGTGDVQLADVPLLTVMSIKLGRIDVKISDLPGHKASTADGGTGGSCPFPTPTTVTQRVCGSIQYYPSFNCVGSLQPFKASPFKFVYDTEPPSAPSIVDATAQDGAASLTFSADSDTVTVEIEVKGPNDLDFYVAGSAVVANTKTVRALGLRNSETYEVRLRGTDGAGNVSTPSSTVSVTPILTQGLLGYYASKGGELEGGCATAPGLAPLMLLALALRSRLRRVKGNTSR